MRPFALNPDDGRTFENPTGGAITFKATAEQTGGAVTAIEGTAAPGEGPPLHEHEQDELIHVLEGTYRVKLGDEMVDAPTGAFVFIPRGTPHTWQNVGDGLARFLAAIMPASPGFEEFFVRYADLPAKERGAEAFARISAETGAMDVVGPPLAESDPLG
jgi:quercetin dioxygenase-like cupin family protein